MLRQRLYRLVLYLFFFTSIFSLSTAIRTNNTINGRKLPIYSVETSDKKISLSFDAAWGNKDLDTILQILEQYHVKTTFFMTGGWIESYPQEVLKIQNAGHELANHSENHKNMSSLSSSQCKEEIMSTHQRIRELTGTSMDLFRPPYGDYNNTVIQAASDCGYYSVQWSVDSLDWKDYGVDSIIQTVTEHPELKPGAIILLHNGAKYTAQALPFIIEKLQTAGYQIVPVSELIYKENYYLDTSGKQFLKRKSGGDSAS